MEMGDALAHRVVHRHKCALGVQADAYRRGQAAGCRGQTSRELIGKVFESLDMAARDQKGMAGEQRPIVEKGDEFGFLEHQVRRFGSIDDLAEAALGHGETLQDA